MIDRYSKLFLIGSFFLFPAVLPGMIYPVIAGGSHEDSESSPAPARTADDTTIREQQIELLSSIGIRVFDEPLASVDFEVARLSGGQASLSDHRGEFVFLNFWATWCPPCREEMPAMEVLQAEMADLPFTILAVSVQEERNTVQRYIAESGFTFPILLDPSGQVASHYGVRGIPTSYFISAEGEVLGMLIGIRDWEDPDVVEAMRRITALGVR